MTDFVIAILLFFSSPIALLCIGLEKYMKRGLRKSHASLSSGVSFLIIGSMFSPGIPLYIYLESEKMLFNYGGLEYLFPLPFSVLCSIIGIVMVVKAKRKIVSV
jgi:hypothetical protein